MADPILPYMRQLPQDYYAKNFVTSAPTVVTPTPLTPNTPPVFVPPVDPSLPVNEGGAWVGIQPPTNPGEGWMFFNENNNTLYIYIDGKWQVVASPSSGGGIAEAPTDGGTYARQNAAWVSTYDGGAY